MTVGARLKLLTLAMLALVSAVMFLLGLASRRVRAAVERYDVMDSITTGVFELDTLTREFIQQPSERVRQQWRQRYGSLGVLRAPLHRLYGGSDWAAERLNRSYDALGVLFGQLSEVSTEAARSSLPRDVAEEREARLAGPLMAHEKAMLAAASSLKGDMRRQLRLAQDLQVAAGLLAGTAAGGVLLFEVFLFRLLVLRPLRQLQHGIETVGRGDLDHRVGLARNDEIGSVSQAFDRMATNLKAITASRDDLDREVSERRRMEAQLAEKNAALEAKARELADLNRELEAFAYSVSHDLRAPLRGIEGFSTALAEDCGPRLDATGQDYLRRVRAATAKMGDLIDGLLFLSRLSRSELRRGPVDLSAAAESVVADLRQRDPARIVDVRIRPGLVADGDARLMPIVLQNLLANAWKFTARTDRAVIEFDAEPGGDECTVYRVRDNGAGFDMAYAGKLFSAFQRLHAAAEYPGTGIGLATVQRIIHRHGGRVWAEGKVGEGASFFFTVG